MNWLFEEPWPILFVGVLSLIVCLVAWVQLQKGVLLGVAAGLLALTVGGVTLERSVVTEREVMELTLQTIAKDLATNDIDAIAKHIASTAPELRKDAESVLRRGTIEKVSVKRNLEVTFSGGEPATKAEATFNAVATVSGKQDAFGNQMVPRFFRVQFVREGGEWKVVSYEQSDPRDGF